MSNLPQETPPSGGDGKREANSRFLSIGNYHESDIRALTGLAQVDKDLAHKVVSQKDAEDRRDHASFRLGLIMASIIAIVMIITAGFALIELGLLATVALALFVILVTALIRVILTGQWSDTSWIGRCVSSVLKGLGGAPKPEE